MNGTKTQKSTHEADYADGLVEGYVLGTQQANRDAASEVQRLMTLLGVTPGQHKAAVLLLEAERRVGRDEKRTTHARTVVGPIFDDHTGPSAEQARSVTVSEL